MNTRRNPSRGIAAIELVFSLPSILLCLALTVYIGSMMSAKVELLAGVQQVTRVCAHNRTRAQAEECVESQTAVLAAQLQRCDNLAVDTLARRHAVTTFDDALDGDGVAGTLESRGTVSLKTLAVVGQCDAIVNFPLPFREFDLVGGEVTERAAYPLRIERESLP